MRSPKDQETMSSTTYPPVSTQDPRLEHAASSPEESARVRSAATEASRSGIWVGIFAITMSFAAYTSALFVREGSGDWAHIALPPILYANTLALLLSSVTVEVSRRSLFGGAELGSEGLAKGLGWLGATLTLGLVFLAGQYEAWRQLGARGLYLATNPNSSFFYVLTGMHVLHLLGGIAALVYLMGRLTVRHATFLRSAFDSTAIYWHFMGVLWLYLLLVLGTKL
jgi:cytochrome c oxidase subunit III